MGYVLRGLLSPRWLGLHVLAVVLAVACVLLGFWQLDRARDLRRSETGADQPAEVALAGIASPGHQLDPGAAGRIVIVEGRYDSAHAFVVPDRRLGSRVGFWVVGLLRTPDGSAICIVRGWSPAAAAPSPPVGRVVV